MSKFNRMMKQARYLIALSFCVIVGSVQAVEIPAAHRDAFGLGDKGRKVYDALTASGQPKFKYVTQVAYWDLFEPTDDGWNHGYIANKIQRNTSLGLYVILDMWPGGSSPDFLDTDYNVPYQIDGGGTRWFDIWNSDYKAEYQEMQKEMINSVALLPLADREKVIAISVNMGKTNDFQTKMYSGDLVALAQEHYPVVDAHMNSKQSLLPNARLLFSIPTWDKMFDQQDHWDLLTWAKDNLTNPWISVGQPGKGYALNREKLMWDHFGTNFLWKVTNGEYSYNRNEVNTSGHDGLCYTNYLDWHFYWLSLYNIHWGTGLLNWTYISDYFDGGGDEYLESYDLLNKYSGEKDPLTAPGAFVALRDGLDAADTSRFPVGTYGAAGTEAELQARAQLIVNDFAAHGATLGDAQYVTSGTIAGNFKYGNMTTGVLNDIGTNVFDGAYQLHMNLMNKSALVGKWQVGPTNQAYGRFAMEIPSGVKALFNLSDDLFGSGALDAETRVKIRVVYYDDGTNNFKVKYNGMTQANKLAVNLSKTNSDTWKEWESGWIDDAKFGNAGNSGSDLFIDATASGSHIIHMVEVTFEDDRQAPVQANIPAKFEAESPDAFHDLTTGNSGDASCGSTDLDAEITSDTGGGCNVAFTDAGEWIEYDLESGGGTFDLVLRVASNKSGKTITVKLDGNSVGTITSPSTGWQSWADRTISNVSIPAGSHTLRLEWDTGKVNLNYVDIQ